MFYGTWVFKNKRPGFKEQSLPKDGKKIHRPDFKKSSFFPKALGSNSVTPASHSVSLKTLFFFLPFLSFPWRQGLTMQPRLTTNSQSSAFVYHSGTNHFISVPRQQISIS